MYMLEDLPVEFCVHAPNFSGRMSRVRDGKLYLCSPLLEEMDIFLSSSEV